MDGALARILSEQSGGEIAACESIIPDAREYWFRLGLGDDGVMTIAVITRKRRPPALTNRRKEHPM